MAKVHRGAQTLVPMREPASLFDLPPARGLIVSGHTHGDQVNLPFLVTPVVPGAGPRDWAFGWASHGDQRAYITSGLGVSILPVRFNMQPEWVMFSLSAEISAVNCDEALRRALHRGCEEKIASIPTDPVSP